MHQVVFVVCQWNLMLRQKIFCFMPRLMAKIMRRFRAGDASVAASFGDNILKHQARKRLTRLTERGGESVGKINSDLDHATTLILCSFTSKQRRDENNGLNISALFAAADNEDCDPSPEDHCKYAIDH